MNAPRPPHLRHVRAIVYGLAALTAGGTVLGCFLDRAWESGPALLDATQLLGLEALGTLLGAAAVGPLTAVFPRIPLRGHLQLGRRALGVSAFLFAALHAAFYLAPALLRNWREIFTPGRSWITGLVLGGSASAILLSLAATSRDAAVRSMGGGRWKRLHRLAHVAIPLALVHAILVGSDFGLRPWIRGVEGDAGCLVGFSLATAAWGALVLLRRRRRRAPPVGPLRHP